MSDEADSNVDAAVAEPEGSEKLQANVPEFASLVEGGVQGGGSIERFYGVSVPVWAELGRASLSLGELLNVGEGTVLKLDRPVSAPVDLMAQGVRVARGEVVVVDDHFAIRIKEIETGRQSDIN